MRYTTWRNLWLELDQTRSSCLVVRSSFCGFPQTIADLYSNTRQLSVSCSFFNLDTPNGPKCHSPPEDVFAVSYDLIISARMQWNDVKLSAPTPVLIIKPSKAKIIHRFSFANDEPLPCRDVSTWLVKEVWKKISSVEVFIYIHSVGRWKLKNPYWHVYETIKRAKCQCHFFFFR